MSGHFVANCASCRTVTIQTIRNVALDAHIVFGVDGILVVTFNTGARLNSLWRDLKFSVVCLVIAYFAYFRTYALKAPDWTFRTGKILPILVKVYWACGLTLVGGRVEERSN